MLYARHQFKFTSFLILFSVFICIFTSCQNSRDDVEKVTKTYPNIEKADSIEILYTIGGKHKATLTAPYMEHRLDTFNSYEFPKSLQTTFYNEAQQQQSVVTALYGIYKEDKGIVYLRDSVRIINYENGDTLYCYDLTWDQHRVPYVFYTDKPVLLKQKDNQYMYGTSMEATSNFKTYHLTQGKGRVNNSDNSLSLPK